MEFVPNPTKIRARQALYDFARECEGCEEAALVALIGHGCEGYGKSYRHFMLADSNIPEGCSTGSLEIQIETITTLEICEMLKWPRYRSKYPPTIFIYDCCRTDLLSDQPDPARVNHPNTKSTSSATNLSKTDLPSDTCKPDVGLNIPASANQQTKSSVFVCANDVPKSPEFQNLCFILSTNAGNTASDGVQGGNGPFVEVFSKLIKQPGKNGATVHIELGNTLTEKHNQECTITFTSLSADFFYGPKPAPPPKQDDDETAANKRRKTDESEAVKDVSDFFLFTCHKKIMFQ